MSAAAHALPPLATVSLAPLGLEMARGNRKKNIFVNLVGQETSVPCWVLMFSTLCGKCPNAGSLRANVSVLWRM